MRLLTFSECPSQTTRFPLLNSYGKARSVRFSLAIETIFHSCPHLTFVPRTHATASRRRFGGSSRSPNLKCAMGLRCRAPWGLCVVELHGLDNLRRLFRGHRRSLNPSRRTRPPPRTTQRAAMRALRVAVTRARAPPPRPRVFMGNHSTTNCDQTQSGARRRGYWF